nr:predicted protein [Ipomoea batatas]
MTLRSVRNRRGRMNGFYMLPPGLTISFSIDVLAFSEFPELNRVKTPLRATLSGSSFIFHFADHLLAPDQARAPVPKQPSEFCKLPISRFPELTVNFPSVHATPSQLRMEVDSFVWRLASKTIDQHSELPSHHRTEKTLVTGQVHLSPSIAIAYEVTGNSAILFEPTTIDPSPNCFLDARFATCFSRSVSRVGPSTTGIVSPIFNLGIVTTAVGKNSTGARCPFMVLGPIFCGSKVPTTGARCPLWSSDRFFVGVRCPLREQGARYGPRTNFCGSKVPTTGARCPFMVLRPIFVGARCPLREQGARYGPRTDFCGSKVPTTGARCPFMVLGPIFVGVRCPLRE